MGSLIPITRRLARWIVELREEEIPARVLKKARHQVASVLAALHAGMDTREGQAVRRAVLGGARPGPCSVIPNGERLTLAEALTINSAYSMALDFDDYLFLGHTGHSAVLGSLAVCQEQALDYGQMLTAVVVANEIGGRVGASAVFGPQNGQAWSYIHAAAGAALASRLYGLTAAQTANALGIAMYQPSFTLWPGFMGPGSKVLTAAGPTVCGVQAARMAAAGLTGAADIFERPRQGFFSHFTYVPLPHMLSGLGRAWVTDTLTYKRFPGCAYVDTTLDALLQILDQQRAAGRTLDPADVAAVTVEASLLTVEMNNMSAGHEQLELSPVNINFSIPHNVALALTAGRHGPAQLDRAYLREHQDQLHSLAARVRVRHSWGMTLEVLGAFEEVLGRNGALAALSARDLLAVVRGYARNLGGGATGRLELSDLLLHHGTSALGRVARAWGERGGRHAPSLDDVDFSRLRMVFPARVTLETRDGKRLTARRDVPEGAPGRPGRYSCAEEKLRRAAGAHLPEERVDTALEAALGRGPLEQIVEQLCMAAPE